ncbi:MAG: YdeI/OmpD-associated family protein [Pseudomonadota bacterium]
MSRDPRVDAYIDRQADFARPILGHIRELIHAHAPPVEETIKWSMPFFTYKGELLANMAAFKAHASFGFWSRQALKTGQEGEAMGQFGRMTDRATMPTDATILAKLDQALAVIDRGEKPKRPSKPPKPEAEVPADLAEALARDDQATGHWTAFPPSCRREYCEWVAGAKREDTRMKRIAQTIEQVREGKKQHWKYETC